MIDRLYFDEDVDPSLIPALQQRGFLALAARDANMLGKSDSEQLDFAVREEMPLLSHNVRDYLLLAKVYGHNRKNHFGIIIGPQMKVGEIMNCIVRIMSLETKESLKNKVIWFQNYAAIS